MNWVSNWAKVAAIIFSFIYFDLLIYFTFASQSCSNIFFRDVTVIISKTIIICNLISFNLMLFIVLYCLKFSFLNCFVSPLLRGFTNFFFQILLIYFVNVFHNIIQHFVYISSDVFLNIFSFFLLLILSSPLSYYWCLINFIFLLVIHSFSIHFDLALFLFLLINFYADISHSYFSSSI